MCYPKSKAEYDKLSEWLSKNRYVQCVDCGDEWVERRRHRIRKRCKSCARQYELRLNRLRVRCFRAKHVDVTDNRLAKPTSTLVQVRD